MGRVTPLLPRHWIGLAAIVAVAAGLRVHGITGQPLSFDELGSLETAAGRGQVHLVLPRDVVISPPPVVTRLVHAPPVWEVPLRMGADVHPPLYFVLLRLWEDCFGDGDAACRGLSAIAGVLGVVVIFDVGRFLSNTATGLWAALLMAVSQAQIAESQDARPYALLVLLVLVAAAALARIAALGASRRRLGVMGAAIVAGCLTHYFVLPAVAALVVYAGIALRGRDRRKTLIALGAAGVVALVLVAPGLWRQVHNFTEPWMYWFNEYAPHHIRATLLRVAVLPIRYLADPPSGSGFAYLAGCLYVLPWLMCGRRPQLILPGLLLVLCPGLIAGLDLKRGTSQVEWVKYSLLAGPGVYLLIPMLLTIVSKDKGTVLSTNMSHVIAAVTVIYCGLAIYESSRVKPPASIRIAADLKRLGSPDDPVFFASSGWGDWYTGTLYMYLEHYADRMPEAVVLLRAPASGGLLKSLGADRGWLVTGWTRDPPWVFIPGCWARQVGRYPYSAMLYEVGWGQR